MIPPIASKFVAGETPSAALEHAREVNDDDISVILNLLGEHYDAAGPADADTREYLDVVSRLGDSSLDACVSIKPSQVGLDVGREVFHKNFRRIAEAGDEHGVFVWCDMEDAMTTDATLDTFEELAREFPHTLGLCVQANLKRTADDVERLLDVPGKIRLVKGAYDEPATIAYKDKDRVDQAYRDLMETLFDEREEGIAIGSHDPAMISHAQRLHDEYGADFEVQMLMGVREEAQRDLAAQGEEVWQYAPYGDKWMSYFYRRVRERRENLLFAVRAVLGR